MKAAVVILAGTESHGDLARLINGLEAAKEFAVTDGDELSLIFDGAGTTWIPELEDDDSEYRDLYESVRAHAVVCHHCAGAFGVQDAVSSAGLVTLDEHDGHPSFRSLVAEGYDVLTF